MDFAQIEAWLLHEAALETDMLLFFESFIWRMIALGLPVDRVSLHIGTLHPQLIGFSWNWNRQDGFCDEIKITEVATASDSYKLNPLSRIIGFGDIVRRKPQTEAAQAEFPLMGELASTGITDYLGMPLSGSGHRNAITIATKHPSGFSDQDIERLKHVLSLFALHVQRHSALRISDNALNAYLGLSAAAKVLNGSIKRGAGKSIRAVIWVSDLRGFTDLSDRLSGSDMLALLNAYFEVMAGAVLSHGGEVLKFIGDGLLAVFPLQNGQLENAGLVAEAAKAALAAAQQAHAGLAAINASAPLGLTDVADWRPLRAGIALHEGEVFFGNIGSPDRLDFTVIGPAVNEASRVEAMQKTLGRNILVTEAVARHLDCAMDDLGEHALRGVAVPIRIFSPV